jgi:outer membrane receptor for ferrienterochelin and colicins
MKRYIAVVILCHAVIAAQAQEKTHIKVYDGVSNTPLEFVTVSTDKDWLAATDSAGNATFSSAAGPRKIVFSLTGFMRKDTVLPLPGNFSIYIARDVAALEEVTVISTTRNNLAIENSPTKVEVIGAEDLAEEASVKPGNIASILGDVSGVQIQQSSATSGNSNVRIQGLAGKYTQIVRDGMPLYDGFSGGFGVLTIPPLDLKQIELVKGSSSTLYGGGAIGGLINLISKRPKFEHEIDALVNYSSLKEGNVNLYTAYRNKKVGYTLFAGYTNQQAVDVNKDGFSDLPQGSGVLVHPRLYLYPSANTIISIGYSGTLDNRKGGDMQVLRGAADSVHRYYEDNSSARNTTEYFVEHYFKQGAKFTFKGNASLFGRYLTSNTSAVNGSQLSYYDEASVCLPLRKWLDVVAGINIVGDRYTTESPDTALLSRYENFTVGAFAQGNFRLGEHTTIEAGLRTDNHQRYGLFVLPRVSVFHRFNEHWAARGGFGMGYKTPNPLVQQNIEYSILDLLPLNNIVTPEVSYGYNAEVNYKHEFSEHVSLFVNEAFFLTRVQNPVVFYRNATGRVDLMNASSPIISKGSDSYVKLDVYKWELYLGYTITDARNTYLTGNNFVALTPRHRGAFIVARELGEHWRAGVEGSYMGSQYRYDGTATPGYFFMASMVQYKAGKHVMVVLNGENLLDYRMSRVESLYTGSVSAPMFKPLWAPIDGRVINLSLRWKL